MDDFDDDVDEETLALIDKLVEQHNADKRATQVGLQAPSPIIDRQGHVQNLNMVGRALFHAAPLPPNSSHPAAAAAVPQSHAAWSQQPAHVSQQPQRVGTGPSSTPANQQWQPRPSQGSAPPATATATGAGILPLGLPGGFGPPLDLTALRTKVSELEGTNKLLRTNLDAAEREKVTLRQRVQQLESRLGASGQGPSHAASVYEMQKQLEKARQQLVFKDQEVQELKRQYASVAANKAPATGIVTQKGISPGKGGCTPPPPKRNSPKKPRIRDEARERQEGIVPPPAPTPLRGGDVLPIEKIQQVHHTAPIETALNDALYISSMTHQTHRPFFIAGSALPGGSNGLDTCGSVLSTLWGRCPSAMALLTQSSLQQKYSNEKVLGKGTDRMQNLDDVSIIERYRKNFTEKVRLVAAGLDGMLFLMESLVYLLVAALNALDQSNDYTSDIAGAAMRVLAQIMTWDSDCCHAALATCDCEMPPTDWVSRRTGAPRSSRVIITSAGHGMQGGAGPDGGTMTVQEKVRLEPKALAPLITRLQDEVLRIQDVQALASVGHRGGRGLLAVTVAAALSQRPEIVEGALHLATALVAGAVRRGCKMSFMMPLMTSGALARFLEVPARRRLKPLGLLRMLSEDPEVLAALLGTLRAEGTDTEHEGRTNGNNQTDNGATPLTGATACAARAGANPLTSGTGKRLRGNNKDDNAYERLRHVEGWVMPALNAMLDSLQIVCQAPRRGPPSQSDATGNLLELDDETSLARTSLSIIAHFLQRGAFPALLALLREEERPGGGAHNAKAGQKKATTTTKRARDESHVDDKRSRTSAALALPGGHRFLAVRLVLLAEEAVKRRGEDQELTPGAPAPWPIQELGYGRLADQVEWQRRLRLAQESLTLLRGLMNAPNTAVALGTLEGLLSSAAVMQRVLTATTRMLRMEGPPLEKIDPIERESWAPALQLAAWAYAIGSSSAAPSLAPPQEAMMQGGLPCCSVADVAHLARGIRLYVVNNHDR